MERLPMCRICLSENARLCILANRNLHKIYEKLTDIPFVTEDYRPILACVFCCAKIKQCYRFMRQCLEAEELFAQMENEDYKSNSLMNQVRLEFCSRLITSPIWHISIEDKYETESTAIKEELPAVSDGLDDSIEPKEEHQSDELEPECLDNSSSDVAEIRPHYYESDLEDDIPLMELRTEVKNEEVSQEKRGARGKKIADVLSEPPLARLKGPGGDVPVGAARSAHLMLQWRAKIRNALARKISVVGHTRCSYLRRPKIQKTAYELEPEYLDKSSSDVTEIRPHYEPDLEDDVPLMERRTDVDNEEVSQKKRRARRKKRNFSQAGPFTDINEYEIIASRRGRKSILLRAGYKYNKERENQDGSCVWRCTKRAVCKARLVIDGENCMKRDDTHDCLPEFVC